MRGLGVLGVMLAWVLIAGGCGGDDGGTIDAGEPGAKKPGPGKKPRNETGYFGTLRKGLRQAREMRIEPARQCIRTFHATRGRYPNDLAELLKEYPALRKTPEGLAYKYDPKTGDIQFVPAEQ